MQWLSGKESSCSAGVTGDAGFIAGSGRAPGGGHGSPLQFSCLENPMDWGAWQVTVQRVTKGWTWLSNFAFMRAEYRIMCCLSDIKPFNWAPWILTTLLTSLHTTRHYIMYVSAYLVLSSWENMAVFASQGCHNTFLQTGGWKSRSLFPHSSGGQKSDVQMPTGLWSVPRLQSTFPGTAQLLAALGRAHALWPHQTSLGLCLLVTFIPVRLCIIFLSASFKDTCHRTWHSAWSRTISSWDL